MGAGYFELIKRFKAAKQNYLFWSQLYSHPGLLGKGNHQGLLPAFLIEVSLLHFLDSNSSFSANAITRIFSNSAVISLMRSLIMKLKTIGCIVFCSPLLMVGVSAKKNIG